MEELHGFSVDIESDGLYLQATKIWYMNLRSLQGDKSISIKPFQIGKEKAKEQFLEWLESFDDGCVVTFHNGLGFDLWALWKLLDITPRVGKKGRDWLAGKPVKFVDTYVLAMYLMPDLPKFSLDYLSSGSEDEKMDYRGELVKLGAMDDSEPKGHEFSFYHPLMDEYCDKDVLAQIGVLGKLWAKAKEMYGKEWEHASFRQCQKDYWLYSAQAFTGVKFNIEKAKALVERVEKEMAEIKAEVDPKLPPRPLKTAEEAYYKMPAKPYTMSGEPSSNLTKWLAKHDAVLEDGVVKAYGIEAPLVANTVFPIKLPMEISDNVELKDYFLEAGWKPSDDHWNFKKGPDGKPIRDEKGKQIPTTPKIQNAGNICPNLLKLNGEVPSKVVRYLSLRNRLGVVTGWLNNWRIEWDGRLSAEISGYTPTFRVKHRVITNCPKASEKVLLGAEMRDMFYVDKGYWYIGTDAAALENRTLAAYTMKYDGGKFADLVLNGDSHTFNSFAFFPHLHNKFDINTPDLKENKEFKPWRDKAKTGAYLLAYGGGINKLASSLSLSKKEAQASYDSYWQVNEGLGKLKEKVEGYYSTTGKNKYVPAWDGRLLNIRGKNVLINCIGQSLGAIAMSIAGCIMDSWLGELYIDEMSRPYYLYKGKVVKRISFVHDEYSWEVEDGGQEEIREMSVKAIIEAGQYLKLPLELDGEGKMSYEGSWRDVH